MWGPYKDYDRIEKQTETMTCYDNIYGDPLSYTFCLDTVNDTFENESDDSDTVSSDYEPWCFW